jgi:hypothetical protein
MQGKTVYFFMSHEYYYSNTFELAVNETAKFRITTSICGKYGKYIYIF